MAKQMSFVAADGTTHSASYWVITQVNINTLTRTGRISFAGFKDLASKVAGLASVGQKTYDLTAEEFAASFLGVLTGNDRLLTQAYLFATSKKDVTVPDSASISFFDTAIDV